MRSRLRPAEDADSLGSYVADLTRALHRRLPDERASDLGAEVEAHLLDRVETLSAGGLDRSAAVHDAIAGFGAPKRLASALADAAYETSDSPVWRLVGRVCVAAIFLPLIGAMVSGQSVFGQAVCQVSYLQTLATLLAGVGLTAALGRRAQTRPILRLVAAAILAVVALSGTLLVWDGVGPTSRLDARAEFTDHDAGRRFFTGEADRLRTGIAFANGSAATVPESLRLADGRIIVPRSSGERSGFNFSRSAFVRTPATYRGTEAVGYWSQYQSLTATLSAQTPDTASTVDGARRLWQERGDGWLRAQEDSVAFFQYRVHRAEELMWAPWLRFDSHAAANCAGMFGVFGLLALAVDAAGAAMGRAVFRRRRQRRLA